MEDRRRDRRISIDLWIEAEEGDELYYQRAANLSAGGAYFAQTVPQKLGTHVELKFSLPGETNQISCKGEIVSAPEKGLGMGVRFIDMGDEDRARIQGLIDKLVNAG